jgi:predicted hydrocarbon binding protein
MKNAVTLLRGEEERIDNESSVVLMRADSFQRMLQYFTQTFGSSGLTMIYSMGMANGKYETSQMRDELRNLEAPVTKKLLLEKTLWRLTSMGWGGFKLEKLDSITGEAHIEIKNNPFSLNCDSQENGGCYFIQGFIAGVVSDVLDEDLTYGSPRCSHGENGSCLLQLKKPRQYSEK